MQPPIIAVDSSGDVLIFGSVQSAERYLEPIDVLQITYNFADTSAEPVMQAAAERGLAVVINRPFDGGDLFLRIRVGHHAPQTDRSGVRLCSELSKWNRRSWRRLLRFVGLLIRFLVRCKRGARMKCTRCEREQKHCDRTDDGAKRNGIRPDGLVHED